MDPKWIDQARENRGFWAAESSSAQCQESAPYYSERRKGFPLADEPANAGRGPRAILCYGRGRRDTTPRPLAAVNRSIDAERR
jgi:hypothetical protein